MWHGSHSSTGRRASRRSSGRDLLIALGLVGILAAAAVISEAHDLNDATDALWGLTTATFGLVVGLLGGEKAAA